MLNIGFYGHSAACWYGSSFRNGTPISFIDQVKEYLNCNIVNVGVPQGSEERILFDLKKTKKIDIAVIFHAPTPRYMFLPKCNRDVAVDSVPENKSRIFWSENNFKDHIDQETFEDEFFSSGKIKELFGDANTFVECMHSHKQYLYHPDLQNNRYEAATLMIDSYCAARIPKVIHISDYPYDKAMPWFKFTSGVIGTDIQELVTQHRDLAVSLVNNISEEGNRLIANRIVTTIRENNWHV
jgi:hypothetical protein